jgi:hypothetical protein
MFETWRLKPEFEFSLNFLFGNKTEIIKEKGKGKTHLGPNFRAPRPSLLPVRARASLNYLRVPTHGPAHPVTPSRASTA